MPKIATEMTAEQVAALPLGRHRVGGVLGLLIDVRHGGRSWTLRYGAPDGRRREVGLGSARDVSLEQARAKAQELRTGLVLDLADPITVRAAMREAAAAAQRNVGRAHP